MIRIEPTKGQQENIKSELETESESENGQSLKVTATETIENSRWDTKPDKRKMGNRGVAKWKSKREVQ